MSTLGETKEADVREFLLFGKHGLWVMVYGMVRHKSPKSEQQGV